MFGLLLFGLLRFAGVSNGYYVRFAGKLEARSNIFLVINIRETATDSEFFSLLDVAFRTHRAILPITYNLFLIQ